MTTHPSSRHDEFYVGYIPHAPSGIARRVRVAVAALLLAALATAAVSVAAFRAPAAATWSDAPTRLRGQIVESPCPALRTLRDGRIERLLLVATGKHGAAPLVRGLNGAMVEVHATILERDGRRLLELADGPDAIRPVTDAPLPPAATVASGRITLLGEIVDPKCFLGAMKPGDGKLHKACAVRCIDGGIPPMLAARNEAGHISYYLLASSDGPINSRVLPFVGELVEITGRVEQIDGLWLLRVDAAPDALRRR